MRGRTHRDLAGHVGAGHGWGQRHRAGVRPAAGGRRGRRSPWSGRSEDRLQAGVAAVEAAAAEARRRRRVPAVLRVATDITDEAAVEAAVAAATGRDRPARRHRVERGRVRDHRADHPDRRRAPGAARSTSTSPARCSRSSTAPGSWPGRATGRSSPSRRSPGRYTHRWFGAYGPAKAGLEMLCMVAADELGASGVRVNTVRPGLTSTDLVEAITAPGPGARRLPRLHAARPGSASPRTWPGWCGSCIGPEAALDHRPEHRRSTAATPCAAGPDLSGLLEGVFGADGLRGVVPEA